LLDDGCACLTDDCLVDVACLVACLLDVGYNIRNKQNQAVLRVAKMTL
jgi:hypothetical protein